MAKVTKSLKKQIEQCAEACRKSGGKVEIWNGLPSVSILLSNGEEYFFQEWAATEILKGVPDNVNQKDYLLWAASGW